MKPVDLITILVNIIINFMGILSAIILKVPIKVS